MIFQKLFAKKVKDKPVKAFWRDIEDRAELFLHILAEDDEYSDDRIWMEALVRHGLARCCIDADVPFSFAFETEREPVRLVFHCMNDKYLKEVGEKLSAYYPQSLAGRLDFCVTV